MYSSDIYKNNRPLDKGYIILYINVMHYSVRDNVVMRKYHV